MNWARALAAPRRDTRRVPRTMLPLPGATRRGFISFLLEEDPRPPHLLRRDHPEEVRQQPIHELEIGGEGRGLLLLAVEDLLRELLLVQGLAGAAVHEVEVRGEGEALALEVAVAAHEPGAVRARVAHHALLGLEAGAVLLLEADPARDDERVLVLLAHLPPVL